MSTPNGREPAFPRPRREDGAVSGFSKLDVAGYILAFVLPLFGVIVGVVLLRRQQAETTRHGVWIIAISLVIGALFIVALIAASHGLGTSEAE
jgi:uncharacterized membrane protein